jgi:oxygen-independent coproporphyrinogen-3 oxidase
MKLSFYIHIPYCLKKCGYCDFNTYTPQELKTTGITRLATRYIDAALSEIELASRQVGRADVPSIFFGGGTPSLMPAAELVRVIAKIRERFDVLADAEITVEVNPDSVSLEFLEELRAGGGTRISMGMQSAVPHVLAALDRTHNPENVIRSTEWVRQAGFEHCSVDLIYGVPGESIEDWRSSITAALSLPIDHISAYALIVEKGTKLAAQVERGELVLPSEDETAEKYLMMDGAAESQGFDWYELSNWAKPGGQSRHNIAYWDGSFWWGIGPGAHSYLGNRRWWNIKHPTTYQTKLATGETPIAAQEELGAAELDAEFLMLNIRMRSGIERSRLNQKRMEIAERFAASGHADSASWHDGRLVLTASGRLIADRIVRELMV